MHLIQLTSLYSLQSSLDVLRANRPDYTPRTGFVWPITDPSLADGGNKKPSTSEEPAIIDETQDLSGPSGKRNLDLVTASGSNPKKQQNTMLLFNAMRTTAAHSSMSFSSQSTTGAESVQPEVSAQLSALGVRSSTTPAPSAPVATPKPPPNAPTPQEAPPTKAPAGGGKKKRKREFGLFPIVIIFLNLFRRYFDGSSCIVIDTLA
jgi:mediator of RNA polymerase II transcription subunit 6